MSDIYTNFRELKLHEQEDQDYRIKVSANWNQVLVVAPHGGNIEPYTSEIAQWIAKEDFAWYLFEGIREIEARKLHITSHNFDEPTLLHALHEAYIVLTIHGLKNSIEEFLMIGGLDTVFATLLRRELQNRGFIVKDCEQKYRGERTTNICNKGRTGKGVQLEISYALRSRIVKNAEFRNRFVEAIRSVIKVYQGKL